MTTEQTERDSAQMNTNTGGGQACGLSVDQIMLEPWEVSAEGKLPDYPREGSAYASCNIRHVAVKFALAVANCTCGSSYFPG